MKVQFLCLPHLNTNNINDEPGVRHILKSVTNIYESPSTDDIIDGYIKMFVDKLIRYLDSLDENKKIDLEQYSQLIRLAKNNNLELVKNILDELLK